MSWAGRKSRRHPRPWPGPAGTQGGGRKCNKHVAWDTERGEAVSQHPKLCWSLSLRSPALIRETTCLLEAPMLLTSLCRRVFPLGVTQCWPERSDVRAPPPRGLLGKVSRLTEKRGCRCRHLASHPRVMPTHPARPGGPKEWACPPIFSTWRLHTSGLVLKYDSKAPHQWAYLSRIFWEMLPEPPSWSWLGPREEDKLPAHGQMWGSFLREMAPHLLVGVHHGRWGALAIWLLCWFISEKKVSDLAEGLRAG